MNKRSEHNLKDVNKTSVIKKRIIKLI